MKKNFAKVAILVHDYFEQAEFEEPLAALKEAGSDVDIITSSEDKNLQGMNHAEMGDKFRADLLLHDASHEDYDALVLPGGAINADHLRMVEAAREWATAFINSDRPIAVICHAPWLLVSADLVFGVKLTSYFTIQDDIRNAGGQWSDQPVVIDNNLITSRHPGDLPSFNDALLTMLSEKYSGLKAVAASYRAG